MWKCVNVRMWKCVSNFHIRTFPYFHIIVFYFAAAISFLPFSIASSMEPTRLNAASG